MVTIEQLRQWERDLRRATMSDGFYDRTGLVRNIRDQLDAALAEAYRKEANG
jgi:hypothetical protein